MSQITVSLEPSTLRAGMKADLGDDVCKSYKNTTGAALPFGVLVELGAADDRLKRITGTGKVIGVVVHGHGESNQGASMTSATPFGTDTDVYEIADKKMASVMRKGYVVVAVEAAVAAETDAWARVTSGGASEIVGAFRGDSDGGDAFRLEGARFVTSTSGAGFAVLELDSPKWDLREDQIVATAGAEAANAIDVVCSIVNPDGTAITAARNVVITTVAATADQGDLAAAGAAVGTFGPGQSPVTGDNTAGMVTTAAGLFSFRVTDTVAEAVQVLITADGCRPRVLRLAFA